MATPLELSPVSRWLCAYCRDPIDLEEGSNAAWGPSLRLASLHRRRPVFWGICSACTEAYTKSEESDWPRAEPTLKLRIERIEDPDDSPIE